jgi:hypothetical protein
MMQTIDAFILKKKFRYLDPVVICEARHAGPKWMKDDDDCVKPFATKKEKQKERHKFHQETLKEGCGLHIAYDDTMGRHGCHVCAIPHLVNLI